MITFHTEDITSGHPCHSSDYTCTSVHPQNVVITIGHHHTEVITSGHP